MLVQGVCIGCKKVGFDTRDAALQRVLEITQAVLRGTNHRSHNPVSVYECPTEGVYHLTSKIYEGGHR